MSGITRKLIVTGKILWMLIGGGFLLVGVIGILTGDMGNGIATAVAGVIAIWFTRWLFGRLESKVAPQGSNPGSPAASSNEDLTRLYDECSSGRFPVIANPPVNLKTGEFAHHACPVEVRQLKTETTTYRGYAGTRVKIGDLPIYLGGSVPQKVSREVLATVGTGNFVITNRRIVLSGTKVNYSIRLDQINDMELFSDAIQIMNEGRYGGRFYMMDDPRRAALFLHMLIGQTS
jgi:hypothetical protein